MIVPVHIRGLVKNHGAIRALDGIDLDVEAGSVTALLGPNGAGKTTTLDILLGLNDSDTGLVSVFGAEPRKAVASGALGAVLQNGTLLPGVTVRELILCMGAQHRSPMPFDHVVGHSIVEELLERRTERLSGGETQRVLFALALVGDPQLLVLDEPTAAMDLKARKSFWAAVRQLAADGRTVLFSTHYLEEADAIADRVVLLAAGRIVADGSASAVRAIGGMRQIRCTLPPGHDDDLVRLPGVASSERHGATVLLRSATSDDTLRALLRDRRDATDVEVATASLADAIEVLTSGAAADADRTEAPHTDAPTAPTAALAAGGR